jgi:hypothetical protein
MWSATLKNFVNNPEPPIKKYNYVEGKLILVVGISFSCNT